MCYCNMKHTRCFLSLTKLYFQISPISIEKEIIIKYNIFYFHMDVP